MKTSIVSTKSLASLWHQKTAFIDVESNVRVSYTQLHHRVETTAGNLSELNLKPGNAIVVLTNPCIEFYVLLLACLKTKLILIPLNWRENFQTLTDQIHLLQPQLILKGNGNIGYPLQSVTEGSPKSPMLEKTTTESVFNDSALIPWFLMHTSGSSGNTKAVIYTEDMVAMNTLRVTKTANLNEHTVNATLLPVHHIAGINLYALPTIQSGGTVVIYPEFDPERLLKDIDNGVFNCLLVVPTVYQKLADHPNFASTNFSPLTSVSSGGAPISLSLLSTYFEDKNISIQNGCGMTETGPALFLQSKEQASQSPGSVGSPCEGWEISLRDHHHTEVKMGSIGEIWVKGPGLTPGFLNHDGTVTYATNQQHWFSTGDLAEMQIDGQYTIVDRLKDIYICGGENIYPGQVEKVLLQHPDIKEAIVVGMPDKTWGEVGIAWVSTKDDDTDIDSEELNQHCKRFLAAFMVPSQYYKVINFPRTPSGKIIRSKLVQK